MIFIIGCISSISWQWVKFFVRVPAFRKPYASIRGILITDHSHYNIFSMYALGHISVGYLIARALKQEGNINIPIIFFASILPDIDLVLGKTFHRSPTHSIIIIALFYTPFLIINKGKTLPDFIATLTHPIIDLFYGETKILWPLYQNNIYIGRYLTMGALNDALTEIVLFSLFLGVFIFKGDLKGGKNIINRLLMLFSLPALIFPLVIGIPISIPFLLIIPHIIMIIIIFMKTLRQP